MKSTIALFSAMAIATSLSFAQEQPAGAPKGHTGAGKKHPSPEKIFTKLDTNNDNSLSLDEFKAGHRAQKNPAKADELFKKIDGDASGGISLEELKANHPQHREGKGGKAGKGRKKPQDQ